MGKRKPPPRQWAVHLDSVYRPDRDERISRAYALALPPILSKPTFPVRKEVIENESASPCRHLRSRLQ